jgi:hypothetical protein
MISTYAELKDAIAKWMHRSDIDDRITDFIALAETRLNQDISDIALLRSEAQLVTTAGHRTYDAPSGMISIEYAHRKEPASTPMQIVPARVLAQKYAHEQYSSIPSFMAFDGVYLVLHPTPNGAYTIDYFYRNTINALSDANPSNIVLERFPDLYLWGACHEAALFARDAEFAQAAELKYQTALARARSADHVGGATLRTDLGLRGGAFNFYSGD